MTLIPPAPGRSPIPRLYRWKLFRSRPARVRLFGVIVLGLHGPSWPGWGLAAVVQGAGQGHHVYVFGQASLKIGLPVGFPAWCS